MTTTHRLMSLLLVAACVLSVVDLLAQDVPANRMDALVDATIELLVDSAGQDGLSAVQEETIRTNVEQMKADKVAALGALLRYSPTGSYPPSGTKRATVLLRQRLAISPQDVLRYALPELEKETCDRERLYALVASVPDPTGDWLDTRFSEEFLRSQRDSLYPPFVQYLYSVYPKKGIIRLINSCIADPDRRDSLLRAAQNVVEHSQMELLLEGRTIDDDLAQSVVSDLTTLAQSKEWWIRYFAARSLRFAPAYREENLLAGLKSDVHPLVQEVVKTAKASR